MPLVRLASAPSTKATTRQIKGKDHAHPGIPTQFEPLRPRVAHRVTHHEPCHPEYQELA